MSNLRLTAGGVLDRAGRVSELVNNDKGVVGGLRLDAVKDGERMGSAAGTKANRGSARALC